MSKIVEKPKEPASKHDFIENAFAKAVTTDFPAVIYVLNKMSESLHPYSKYQAVWHIIQTIEDNKILMQLQLDHYSQIYKNKGKVDG